MKTFVIGTAGWFVAGLALWAQAGGGLPSNSEATMPAAGFNGPPAFSGQLPPKPTAVAPAPANTTVKPPTPTPAPDVGGGLLLAPPRMAPFGSAGAPGGGVGGSNLGGGDNGGTGEQLPTLMVNVDNELQLAPNVQFRYQVLEDGDPEKIVLVNEQGNVTLPYVKNPIHVSGKTLLQLCEKVQDILLNGEPDESAPGGRDKPLYRHATVLAAPYSSEKARGEVAVYGQVNHPGDVVIPPDSILRISQVILAAGGLAPEADGAHVRLWSRDANGAGAELTPRIIDVKSILAGNFATEDVIVQPGDRISVPLILPSDVATVTVYGEVGQQGAQIIIPPNGGLYVSQAVQRAGGFTEWADKDVTLYHYDAKGNQTGKQDVDVGAVEHGDKSKDVKVQPGDVIRVGQLIFRF